MAWYDRIIGRTTFSEDYEKLNPSQSHIAGDEGGSLQSRENATNYKNAYEQLEVVNRAVNMIVDDAADVPFEVGEQVKGRTGVVKNVRRSKVAMLLNIEPNPFQDISTFKRNLVIDLLIDGNIFVYFDGMHLYHLPAEHVTIETSEKNYISKFVYDSSIEYSPNEIIHIKENSYI